MLSSTPEVAMVRGVRWRVLIPALASFLALAVVPNAHVAAVRTPSSQPEQLVRVVVRALPSAGGVEHAITAQGGSILRRIGIIDGYSAAVPQDKLAALRATDGVAAVDTDAPLHLLSNAYSAKNDKHSLFQIEKDLGARDMWGKHRTGAGIDVALIDSGVTPVPGLDDSGKVVYGPDLSEESQSPATENLDTYGHGTFMAGIIAAHDPGIDAAKQKDNADGFLGFAPDARVVSVKVADAHGATDVSQVLAGIDWVVQHAHDNGMNIRVLNLSFGTDSTQSYTIDPLAYATEVAWRAGIAVVTSAGNSGAADGRLTTPASDPFVIAVGADDMNGTKNPTDDAIPSFSSQGDGTRNPDFVMPGAHVQSLRVPGSFIDSQFADTGAIDGRFFRGSGTSEAAAAASGTAALLLSAKPSATPDQIKATLIDAASRLPKLDAQAQGAGIVDLHRANDHIDANKLDAATQGFVPSNGTGSLDASRGSSRLELSGVTLSGEQDIFGSPVDTTRLAASEAAGTAWAGGMWNGQRWSGDGWSGVRWSGSRWSGSDWSGSRWSSDNWSNGTWDGLRWSGDVWSGEFWS
jgi:serine protease AprX